MQERKAVERQEADHRGPLQSQAVTDQVHWQRLSLRFHLQLFQDSLPLLRLHPDPQGAHHYQDCDTRSGHKLNIFLCPFL